MKRSLTAKTEDNDQHSQKKPARKVVAEVYVLQDGVDTGSIVGRDTRNEYAVIRVFCDSNGVVAIRRGGLDGGDEVLIEEHLACGDRVSERIKDRAVSQGLPMCWLPSDEKVPLSERVPFSWTIMWK